MAIDEFDGISFLGPKALLRARLAQLAKTSYRSDLRKLFLPQPDEMRATFSLNSLALANKQLQGALLAHQLIDTHVAALANSHGLRYSPGILDDPGYDPSYRGIWGYDTSYQGTAPAPLQLGDQPATGLGDVAQAGSQSVLGSVDLGSNFKPQGYTNIFGKSVADAIDAATKKDTPNVGAAQNTSLSQADIDRLNDKFVSQYLGVGTVTVNAAQAVGQDIVNTAVALGDAGVGLGNVLGGIANQIVNALGLGEATPPDVGQDFINSLGPSTDDPKTDQQEQDAKEFVDTYGAPDQGPQQPTSDDPMDGDFGGGFNLPPVIARAIGLHGGAPKGYDPEGNYGSGSGFSGSLPPGIFGPRPAALAATPAPDSGSDPNSGVPGIHKPTFMPNPDSPTGAGGPAARIANRLALIRSIVSIARGL